MRLNVEQAAESPSSLWKLAKWSRNRHNTPTVTPELQSQDGLRKAATPEEKVTMFRDTFFPPPPDAALADIEGAAYDDQMKMPPVTAQEVSEAIHNSAPLKAPGPDRIINKSLQLAESWLTAHLVR